MANSEPRRDAHTEHCCAVHGCKYAQDETCTVTTKVAPQARPCQYCEGTIAWTDTDLDALPNGTVVLTADNLAAQKFQPGLWFVPGDVYAKTPTDLLADAYVRILR